MFAIVFILIATIAGMIPVAYLLRGRTAVPGENRIWVFLFASFGCGVVFASWILYFVSWVLHAGLGVAHPLAAGNVIVMLLLAAGIAFVMIRGVRDLRSWRAYFHVPQLIASHRALVREAVFYVLFFAVILFTMYWCLFIRDGQYYLGFTVFSDYAPHFAMVRSFSYGANFPTQYPYFGGQDIKYHFVYQFFIGNMEYLGLPLVPAYNVLSALGLSGFLVMLSQITWRITRRFSSAVLVMVLFFFRSGTAFFRYVWEGWQAGDLVERLMTNELFIGYTPNENWGLWTYNVYLNQRHLGFTLLLCAFLIYYFMHLLEEGYARHPDRSWVGRMFKPDTFRSNDPLRAALCGVILGALAFWNGAAVIGTLLILFGMAVFSESKVDYLLLAIWTVVLAFGQTILFIHGRGIGVSFLWGFIAEDKSIPGVLWFLVQVSGVAVLGAIVLMILSKDRVRRVMLFAFLLPTVFAFTMSMTPDVTVNHKYIMISFAFLGIFWGDAIVTLWKKKKVSMRLAAVLLAILLTVTGIYDFVITIRDNGPNRSVTIPVESDLTEYLSTHITSEDLVLCAPYSAGEVPMSGIMMYCGWPYYAWSAGYDTGVRWDMARNMYTTHDSDALRTMVMSEGIDFILFEAGTEIDGTMLEEETIAGTFPLVYTSENGRVRVYQVR